MAKERVLITVKTYPTLSKKYGETVCTAGLREDGSWIRMYPVPFRRLGEEEQYRKYDWIECELRRKTSDPRPETYSPTNLEHLKPVSHIDTADNWRERRRFLLGKAKVYDKLDDLITGAKRNLLSLAIFKPTRILDFFWEEDDREWDPEKLSAMRKLHSQLDLFDDSEWRKVFAVIPKLPHRFSYRFEDGAGRRSEMQILDWEAGQLYWNCLKSCGDDEVAALTKVKAKYLGEFTKTDLHFYLGTTQQFHFVAPNPWVIIGVLPIPLETQPELFTP